MMANQFVRRDGREASKLVVNDNVVSSSEGHDRIFLDSLANFTLPFGMSDWRCEGHHLKRRCGKIEYQKETRGQEFHLFLRLACVSSILV